MSQSTENGAGYAMNFPKKVWVTVGVTALVVVILLLFKTLFNSILLIFVGILLAIYFHGFAGLLKRYLRLPSTASVIVSVLFTFLLLVGFFWFAGDRLSQQVAQMSERIPRSTQQLKQMLDQSPIGSKMLNYLESSGNSQQTRTFVKQLFTSTFGIFSDVYIILLMGLFFTFGASTYHRGIIHLLPAKAKDKGDALMRKLGRELKAWLKGQIVGVVFIGVLSAVGLLILGIPLVFSLALIAGLMNFIPNFGPFIALVPAVLLGLTQGTNTALYIAIIYTGIQVLQTLLFRPLITKRMVDVPPALIIIGQITMGTLGASGEFCWPPRSYW